jgi:hypothetical protein
VQTTVLTEMSSDGEGVISEETKQVKERRITFGTNNDTPDLMFKQESKKDLA